MAARATEDSHKLSATEPSVPLVAMDYGFLGHDTDVIGVIHNNERNVILRPQIVRRSTIRKVFSLQTRDLDCVANSVHTPWNRPPRFGPVHGRLQQ